jgi:hypothetical protein
LKLKILQQSLALPWWTALQQSLTVSWSKLVLYGVLWDFGKVPSKTNPSPFRLFWLPATARHTCKHKLPIL